MIAGSVGGDSIRLYRCGRWDGMVWENALPQPATPDPQLLRKTRGRGQECCVIQDSKRHVDETTCLTATSSLPWRLRIWGGRRSQWRQCNFSTKGRDHGRLNHHHRELCTQCKIETSDNFSYLARGEEFNIEKSCSRLTNATMSVRSK